MYYTVYKITNKINGHIYVGVHKTEDLNDEYMGSGTLIRLAIKAYGIENFEKEYLAIFDNPEEMLQMEAKIVNETFVHSSNTYNMKEGGVGGDTSQYIDYDNPEHRRRITEGLLKWYDGNDEARKVKSEQMAKLRALELIGFKGKHHTEETKRRIGEANSAHQKGKGNSQYGTCWIHSLTEQENRKIKIAVLQSMLDKGWSKGRKMKF